jgi:probable F420-dependent oxidoreductase
VRARAVKESSHTEIVDSILVRFSVALPRIDAGAEFIRPSALLQIAQAAEAAGLDACHVTDHPFPLAGDTAAGRQSFDPFSTLAFIAAGTNRLLLHTNVLVPAYRNPFLVANEAMTVNHLSGGRLILGVGAGYLEPEFAALGVNFAERNELIDEAIEAMRMAWSGDPITYSGRHWLAAGNALPVLEHPVAPPIWAGGNSTRAMERAVAACQGWSPFQSPSSRSAVTRTGTIGTLADLRAKVAHLNRIVELRGRTQPLDICFLIRNAWSDVPDDLILGELAEFADIGVTWIALAVEASSLEGTIDRIHALGTLLRS